MKTLQEVFNTIAEHLVKQGKRSMSIQAGCAYRGDDGTACAVGCLISDEAYGPHLEAKTVTSGLVQRALKNSGIDLDAVTFNMLLTMQRIHDSVDPEEWAFRLKVVANQYRLSLPDCLKSTEGGAQ